MEKERIIEPKAIDTNESILEKSLRPKKFSQYIGQEIVKEQLTIYIKAAHIREEALDHVLLYGPPGLGKTTIAFVIANELGVNLRQTSGAAIEKPGDLVAVLNELEAGDVLFIDEIHRLPRIAEELLYSAMEDFYVDIMVGTKESTHPVHFSLPPFTLIGATTRAGMLSEPLRARFGIINHMEYYTDEELQEIVKRSAEIFNVDIKENGAFEIAKRSRGTPRIANRLLKRVRDFAQIKSDGVIRQKQADEALNMLQVDHMGLDYIDQKLMKTLIEIYQGGPVGIRTLAVNIAEDTETVEDMYEPYLIQIGFIKRTTRGRKATNAAYQHFGYDFKEE
ncbi:MAG: Holliday junction branch migration DNA helicase RuvB [Streptococcaceae bacterium]|jgi:Holliday junction DNA helicase RuvB|nr:Holliday junction branch migration DNA helicase RuvB [Streptococcaceae bacterium]